MIPNDIYRSLVERGTEMAEKEFNHQQLADQTKSILAEITLEIKRVEGGSMAEVTQMGLACSNYRDHLKAVAEARRDATVAKVTYYATRSLFEAQRTVEATHRAAGAAAR